MTEQFGLNLIRFVKAFIGLPRYIRDYIRFRKNYTGKMTRQPCLHDWHEQGGETKSEYFWQDLMVARWINSNNPQRHIDIGSRVDGFVAHVASFREIEVFDVRPISTLVPGVIFRQADLTQENELGECCDSLSCLHAIEHFGLGRYGDPIDAKGFESGIFNMAKILKPEGVLYLSTPIGIERVEFNANRVFDPCTLIECAKSNGLELQELHKVTPKGAEQVDLSESMLKELGSNHYNLGIFIFRKNKASV